MNLSASGSSIDWVQRKLLFTVFLLFFATGVKQIKKIINYKQEDSLTKYVREWCCDYPGLYSTWQLLVETVQLNVLLDSIRKLEHTYRE